MRHTSAQHRAAPATRTRSLRRAGGGPTGIALGLALLLTLVSAAGAFASNSACRTDPIVWLSDGHMLNLTAGIGASVADVQHITYTLHIPQGLSVRQIVYTKGSLGDRESVTTVADQPGGRFTATTVVQTPTGDFPIEVTLQVKLQGPLGQDKKAGLSNLPITLVVSTTQVGATSFKR